MKESINNHQAPPHAVSHSASNGASNNGAAMNGEVRKSEVLSVEEMRRAEQAGALVMAARNSLRRGRREEARAQIRQAYALCPTDCATLELVGDVFLEEGEQEKAIAVFERGLKYHPSHAAFEEKIALAHVDLEEMKRDALLKEAAIKGELPIASGKASERKPGSVAFLSLLLPGAGQYYNEEPERGAVFLGISLLLFAAWVVPWRFNWNMGGAARIWIAVMLLAWLASHVMAASDAANSAKREAEERKRLLGL